MNDAGAAISERVSGSVNTPPPRPNHHCFYGGRNVQPCEQEPELRAEPDVSLKVVTQDGSLVAGCLPISPSGKEAAWGEGD